MTKHIPVLMEEAIHETFWRESETVKIVDGTLGGGGYSLKILNKITVGKLFSLDMDSDAIENYKQRLVAEGFSLSSVERDKYIYKKGSKENIVINTNFSLLEEYIDPCTIDSIVVDLGWSTDQLERIEGLSYQKLDADLDMRFSQELFSVKASDLLNVLDSNGLYKLFDSFTDLGHSKIVKLAKSIINYRKRKAIQSVSDLVDVLSVNKMDDHKAKSQIFQALRIAVNNEYESLRTLVFSAEKLLKEQGRLVVVTFHSGEDSILLDAIDQVSSFRQLGIKGKSFGRPSVEELKINLSARSAKLFVFEKNEQKK